MKIRFIGYGSLLSHESMSSTISDRKITLVIVKGFKRIFDVDLDPSSSKDLDVLNVEKSPNDFFNAVMIEINEEELAELKKREKHYVFEKVTAKDFITGEIYKDCFLSIDYDNDVDSGIKKPDKEYFKLCREAAYNISDEFGELFDTTTYTSDGTSVKDFLELNPNY